MGNMKAIFFALDLWIIGEPMIIGISKIYHLMISCSKGSVRLFILKQ